MQVGLTGGNTSLFATGIYGTVKVIATGIFLIIGIERFGRKWPLVAGVWFMAVCMFIIGALLVSFPPDPDAGSVSSPSIAMVVMIYLYVIAYSASFGPIPWVYVAEIFPTRLRAYGVGMASATQVCEICFYGYRSAYTNPTIVVIQLRRHKSHPCCD